MRHQGGVVERGELDEPNAVRKSVYQPRSNLDGDARFPDSPGSNDADERRRIK
jgi:hypothetical protein